MRGAPARPGPRCGEGVHDVAEQVLAAAQVAALVNGKGAYPYQAGRLQWETTLCCHCCTAHRRGGDPPRLRGHLHVACVRRRDRCATPDRKWSVPLKLAAQQGGPPLVQVLLDTGADPNYAGGLHKASALGAAATCRHLNVMRIPPRPRCRPTAARRRTRHSQLDRVADDLEREARAELLALLRPRVRRARPGSWVNWLSHRMG